METLLYYRVQGKYLLHEFVIMPDHFHAILTPAEEISLEKAVQFIKGGFSHRLHSRLPVWQASFTNQRIHGLEDFERYRNYIRMNPVRAKLVVTAEEYSYCSVGQAFALDSAPPGLKPRLLAG
jgi:putative transposase